MNDSYLGFANTKFGSKLTSMLGLPQPRILERYENGQAGMEGSVLFGSASGSELINPLLDLFERMNVSTCLHASASLQLKDSTSGITEWHASEQVKALVYDASGLESSAESCSLYAYLSETVRSIQLYGRVILIGRPPSKCITSSKAIAQRALEGLSRSLAKELKLAITVQLVYVEDQAEDQLESTLRFLLSTRSSYVSGQVINVIKSRVKIDDSIDWSLPFAGKKVLITGASQGIGASIANVLARDGAEVICLDVPQAETALNELTGRLKGRSLLLDLNLDNAADKLLEAAQQDYGWDVIVHNAGITKDKTIANMTPNFWSSVININLSCQERINDVMVSSGGLKQGGRIVCVSSISGIAGNRGQCNYAYSKAGVIGMVESLAPLLAKKDITINAVAPGFIETKMTAAIPLPIREAGRRLNSLSQGGLPVDVAETIAWLASPASNGLTSNIIRVCGQSILGA